MVDRDARDPYEVLSFKARRSRRRMLEAIQSQKDHDSLSDTLREAMDEYIARELNAPKVQTRDDAGDTADVPLAA